MAMNGAAGARAGAANAGAPSAVLLDKDGTLIENVPYNVEPSRMRLTTGAGEALARLGALGVPLAVVSNQPGVALGRFEEASLAGVRDRLAELFAENGARLAGFFYCPHHPEGRSVPYGTPCQCRKPAPGMLLRAGEALGIDLTQAWMVGDILDDIEAGRRAGCRTVLVDCGNETEWIRSPMRTPHYIVKDLEAAVRRIEGDAALRRGSGCVAALCEERTS